MQKDQTQERLKTQSEFGGFVREKRLKKNIRLREFSRMVGISPAYISKMEMGESAPPKEENIKKMATILNVDTDMLLAKANKISADIQAVIVSQPSLYASLLRRAKPTQIKKLLEDIE